MFGFLRTVSAGHFRRSYRTRTGVFGHTPKPEKQFSLPQNIAEARASNPNLFRLVSAYRDYGHLISNINPVNNEELQQVPELLVENYSISLENNAVKTLGLVEHPLEETSTKKIIDFLKQTYCGTITSNLGYLSIEKKEWMARQLESAAHQTISNEKRKEIGKILIQSEIFDNFLGSKFPTLKRYGLEGAEAMLPFFKETLDCCNDVAALVVAMTHRGRLNLLTGLFNVSPSLVFSKIKGNPEMTVDSSLWIGDVLSHLYCSAKIGETQVTMLPNPSHLELGNPVSMGKTRARQMRKQAGDYNPDGPHSEQIVNIQVHGDAAFAGQGVNQEMLAFCRLPHFNVGGSIHLVVNNQLGFTTPGERGRSSRYSSDLAKTIDAPVIHVNGDDPEKVVQAAQIAVKYQKEFKEDIFVEMHCYRRKGHNELDDPTFTNPVLYKNIAQLETLPQLYKNQLVQENVARGFEILKWGNDYQTYLSDMFKTDVEPPRMHFEGQWSGMQHAGRELTTWETGTDIETLRYIGLRSVAYPRGFQIHPHLLKTHVRNREKNMMEVDSALLDWSSAEAMAIGSLLLQGFNVRISGQDVGRGTFSHRHVMLVDQSSGDIHIPLNDCEFPGQGQLEVANSILSEEAVLAFEYGASIDNPNLLVIWEAQFGDFINGAQNVIDVYVTSGEAKWAKSSSLTMLLPHGYDGAGPEHSSSRVERFLQMSSSSETYSDSDLVNFQVAWPSSPAQYYHLLRRQQIRNFRCPLVVISPKTLLRLSAATSRFSDLAPGTHFQNVIAENNPKARKLVFTSGKHFYTLLENKPEDVAIVRIESLVPFPTGELQQIIASYPKIKSYVWSQEEPRNMGAWSFVRPRFENLVGMKPTYAGRPALSAPAYGLPYLHKNSLQQIISETFA